MLVDIDLDLNNRVVAGPGLREALSEFRFKLDTDNALDLRFWKGGIRVELPDGTTGQFGVKEKGKFDGLRLVEALAWTKTGTGVDAIYTFEPAFTGAALTALLNASDGNVNNDLTDVACIAEIKWIAGGRKNRTPTVPTVIENNVLKDEDDSPTPASSPIGTTVPSNGSAIISGGIENDGFPIGDFTLPFFDISNGKSRFQGDPGAFSLYCGAIGKWFIGLSDGILFESTAAVASPELIPAGAFSESNPDGWKALGLATGVPVVSVTHPTSSPPHICVDENFFHIKNSLGIWKKTALSAL